LVQPLKLRPHTVAKFWKRCKFATPVIEDRVAKFWKRTKFATPVIEDCGKELFICTSMLLKPSDILIQNDTSNSRWN
jgi:hypothetical protein